MTDQTFELQIERRLRAHTDRVSRRVDHGAVAAAAMAAGQGSDWLGRPWSVMSARRDVVLFMVLTLLVAVVAGAVLVAGNLFSERPQPLDPRVLALVKSDGLYLADADGTNQRLVLAGAFESVAWSPDGQRLVVGAAGTSSDPGYRVLTPFGETLTVLEPQYHAGGRAAWSPDGQWILDGAIEDGRSPRPLVRLLASTGGPGRTVVLPTDGQRRWRSADTIAWRPDGEWVIASLRRDANLCHEMVLVPLAEGAASVLVEDGEALVDCIPHHPIWSNDGTLLATIHSRSQDCWPYQGDSRCPVQLVIRAVAASGPPLPTGQPRLLIEEPEGILGPPLWLPGDGALVLAIRSADDGTADLAVAPVDGGAVQLVASMATVDLALQWGTPGRSVLYRTGAPSDYSMTYASPYAGELHLLDIETRQDVVIASDVIAADLQEVAP